MEPPASATTDRLAWKWILEKLVEIPDFGVAFINEVITSNVTDIEEPHCRPLLERVALRNLKDMVVTNQIDSGAIPLPNAVTGQDGVPPETTGASVNKQRSNAELLLRVQTEAVLSVLRKCVDEGEKNWAFCESELERVFGGAEVDDRVVERKRDLSELLKLSRDFLDANGRPLSDVEKATKVEADGKQDHVCTVNAESSQEFEDLGDGNCQQAVGQNPKVNGTGASGKKRLRRNLLPTHDGVGEGGSEQAEEGSAGLTKSRKASSPSIVNPLKALLRRSVLEPASCPQSGCPPVKQEVGLCQQLSLLNGGEQEPSSGPRDYLGPEVMRSCSPAAHERGIISVERTEVPRREPSRTNKYVSVSDVESDASTRVVMRLSSGDGDSLVEKGDGEKLHNKRGAPSLCEVFNTPPASQNPFSQGGSEKLADGVHDTTVLEPALLARMSAAASLPEISADQESGVSVKMLSGNNYNLDGRAEIPLKVAERSSSVTRCGGITLHGNQCTHNVKDGSGFCVKHTKTDVYESKRTELDGSGGYRRGATDAPLKATDMIVFRCRGKTLNGSQCTHNVKDGAVYCLKHGDQAWGPPVKERAFHLTPAQIPTQVVAQVPVPVPIPIPAQVPVHIIPVQVPVPVPAQIPVQTQAIPIVGTPSPKEDDEGAGIPRCVGRTRRTEEQCSFRPKSGSLFCERHARQFREKGRLDPDMMYDGPSSSSPAAGPSASASLKRRRSQEAMNVGDSISTRERRSLSKAKDLFTDILNAGLLRGKAVSTDGKDLVGWICQEATKDVASVETLLGLLSEEKGRLRRVIMEDREQSSVAKPRGFWETKFCPNRARSYLEVIDNRKECVKGNTEDAVQRSVSSDRRGTCESCPSTGRMMRQGSESNRGVHACALCMKEFSEISSLGRHWKEDHKKEASLFQKGVACCECGQEYTNRGGLLRHWRSTHPSLAIEELGVIVCMICDAMFKDFSMLWMHVEERHSVELSSTVFAQRVGEGMLRAGNAMKCVVCGEEFGTQLEFINHKESAHGSLLSSDAAGTRSMKCGGNGSEASPSKFKCKFCGQRFNLLPDLGRHHQAEHRKPVNKVSTSPGALQGMGVKLLPLVKRTPLPDPETGSSPAGKSSPLSELCTPRSSSEIAEQGEHRSSVAMEWPSRMPVVAVQPQSFNFRHLKTIAREKRNVEAPGGVPPPVLPSALPSVPVVARMKRRWPQESTEFLQNDKLVPAQKKLGRPPKQAMQIVQHMKAAEQSEPERFGSNVAFRAVAVDEGFKGVSKMPLQRAPNTTGWPSSSEILDAARVACCKASMYGELAKKHHSLHPNLHLQAIALLTVMGADTQWLADAFLCPNQCSPFRGMAAALPALEVDMTGFSEAPFKSQADHWNDKGPAPLETINIKDVIKGKHIVMHEDLSNGQEPVPIPCVIDEDVLRPCSCASCRENGANPSADVSEPWKCFNYINARLLDPSLGLDTENSKLGCACGEGRCNPGRCDHVMMFDNDNAEACDKSGVAIRGRFPYDEQGRIILEEGYMVYECNSSCHCWEDCQNRVLQKGVRVKLEVFKSRHKGWAVRAAEPIRSGTFVCEYIGEVVNDREANQRGVRYDQDGCSYLYDIDAHLDVTGSRAGAKPFVIDATKHGNVARFINHSCAPNLINYEVLVESMDCQLAHIGFFARRDIGAGEELAYDYRYKLLPGKGAACHCGAPACRGRLY